jgi:hypothetical protein
MTHYSDGRGSGNDQVDLIEALRAAIEAAKKRRQEEQDRIRPEHPQDIENQPPPSVRRKAGRADPEDNTVVGDS